MTPVCSSGTLFTHKVVLVAVPLDDLEGAQPSFVQLVAIRAHFDIDQVANVVDGVFPVDIVTLLRQELLLSNILTRSVDDHLS